MGRTLRLDVLIPTHNRAPMLERCLGSVLRADPPDNLDVLITVICNACSDGSRAVVLRYQAAYPDEIAAPIALHRRETAAPDAR